MLIKYCKNLNNISLSQVYYREKMSESNNIVGISQMIVSKDINDTIITYSLGSCLGVTIYDPVAKVGGMIHCLLALSKIDLKKAAEKPAMFVDAGIPLLFKSAYALGAEKKRIKVKAAGCAQLMDPKGMFKIGQRNYTVLKKLLWKNNILIEGESIGESVSRTMLLDMKTGVTKVKSMGKIFEI